QQGMTPNEYSSYLESLRQMNPESGATLADQAGPGSGLGIAFDVPGNQAVPDDPRQTLYLSQGDYRQRGEYIYQCYLGRGCNEIVGHISEFRIIDDTQGNDRADSGRQAEQVSPNNPNTPANNPSNQRSPDPIMSN